MKSLKARDVTTSMTMPSSSFATFFSAFSVTRVFFCSRAISLTRASSAAFLAPSSSFLASSSRADSRSMPSAYFALSGDAVTTASMSAFSAASISDSGARRRVHATGVGAPRSFITVTTASPMPRLVMTSPRSSYALLG